MVDNWTTVLREAGAFNALEAKQIARSKLRLSNLNLI